ncbi:MAG: HlyD family efflux transporter periplasmic adaptor subunit [Synechococcus sp. ELA057]
MTLAQPAEEGPPRRSSRANLLVIGLGSGLLLAALSVLMHVLTTRARDAVVDADFIELASPINGQLEELRVDAGLTVKPGEPLARVRDPRASENDMRQLRTAVTTAQASLDQLEARLKLQRQLVSEFSRDAGDQQRLETARSSNELDQIRADLARERQQLAFSQRDMKRQEALFLAGAVAENVVDKARTAAAKQAEQVQALEASLHAQENRLQAARLNLNLDRTRGGTDPLPRLQEGRLQVAQLEGERTGQLRRLKSLNDQLMAAENLFLQQSNVWLKAPTTAVVWRIQARTGDTLRIQQPVLRLVNCRRRWVSTYVSEKDLKRLEIGSRARVDLVGEDLDLRGEVDLIRSGVGRQSSKDRDPGPLPSNLSRESQVRVRIDSDVPAPPRKLCFVGYSARVIFQ